MCMRSIDMTIEHAKKNFFLWLSLFYLSFEANEKLDNFKLILLLFKMIAYLKHNNEMKGMQCKNVF